MKIKSHMYTNCIPHMVNSTNLRKMELVDVYKPYMYVIWSITLVLVDLVIHFFVHLSNCGFTMVSFHEIHYKMNRMLIELGLYFLVEKSASSC